MNRWDGPRNQQPTEHPYLDLFFTVFFVIGVFLMLAIGAWVIFGGDKAHGDELCPDGHWRPYADLTVDQLPCMNNVEFDGAGHAHLTGSNPDSGLVWHAATFHVPNPDQWHDGQTLTAETTLPAGPFDFELPCEAGAAQVDVWLEDESEPYAAATTEDCATVPSCTSDVLAPAASAAVSERHDGTPSCVGAQQGVLGGGETYQAPSTPGPAAPNAATTNPPPVAAAASRGAADTYSPVSALPAAPTTLPNTGRGLGLLLVVGAALIVAGISLLAVRTGRKS